MFTSGPTRPPRRSTRPPPLRPERTPLNTPAPPVPAVRRPRPSHERIFGWSVVASVVVHLLILVLSPVFLRIGEPPGTTGDEPDRFARQTMQAIDAVMSDRAPETPAEASPASDRLPLAPSERRPPTEAVVPRTGDEVPVGAPASPPAAAGARESVREGLRTGPRDARLWVNPREVPLPEQSDRERYQAHIQARIDAINDSIRGDAERARRATDWTVRDGEGRRWGLSPEGLHLGGVTIPPQLVPRPAPTGDNQSLERQREEQRQRDEIRRQEEARDRRRQSGGDP
jgi:hypothetical protein